MQRPQIQEGDIIRYHREWTNRQYEAVKEFEQSVKTASASFGKKLREKIYNYYGIEEEN